MSLEPPIMPGSLPVFTGQRGQPAAEFLRLLRQQATLIGEGKYGVSSLFSGAAEFAILNPLNNLAGTGHEPQPELPCPVLAANASQADILRHKALFKAYNSQQTSLKKFSAG
jgi:hypothetical protein